MPETPELVPVLQPIEIHYQPTGDGPSPAALYLARLAPASRRTMAGVLDRVARLVSGGEFDALDFPWPGLRYQHVQALRAYLADTYSPAHSNKTLAAVRGVLKECWRLGLLSRDDFERAVDVPRVRGESLPRGRALSGDEIARLLDACRRDEGPAARRDAALLSVAFGTGLRRAEVVALDLDDVDLDTGEVTVRSGKGRKDRVVFLPEVAREAVEEWLGVRGSEAGPLCVRIRKGERVTSERLSAQGLYVILRKRAR